MNKKIIASVLAVASVLTVSAGALADDNITVTVNGNNVSFVEITPFIENDHTLVPMRENIRGTWCRRTVGRRNKNCYII